MEKDSDANVWALIAEVLRRKNWSLDHTLGKSWDGRQLMSLHQHIPDQTIMASLPFSPQFICRQCILNLSQRSSLRKKLLNVPLRRNLRTSRPLSRRTPHFESQALSKPARRIDAPTGRPSRLKQSLRQIVFSNSTQLNLSQTPDPPQKSKEKTIIARDGLETDFSYYWETIPPTAVQKSQASHYFSKNRPQFLRSVAFFRQFPESDVPEVAFVGRSNVGKSSLLNAIVDKDIKQVLARTSKTPGCTRTMNLYGIGPGDGVRIKPGRSGGHDKIVGVGGLLIVDLPGYGEGSLVQWGVEIMKYLTNRKQLRRVFVLVDASHGIKDKDRSLLATLRLAGIPHQVLLSKVDKIYVPVSRSLAKYNRPNAMTSALRSLGSVEDVRKIMGDVRKEIQPPVGGGALGELLAVSSEVLADGKGLGIDSVRVAVLRAAGVNFEAKKGKGLMRT